MAGSTLSTKLNLREGMGVRVIAKPETVQLAGLGEPGDPSTDAVLAFVLNLEDVERKADPVVEAAKEDRIAWMAYPKAGKLGTDLNRDILWKRMEKEGIRAVRQVAIDETWSAMRFRPA